MFKCESNNLGSQVQNWEQKEDKQLALAVQEGVHQAFCILVKRHHQKFYQLAFRFMQDAMLAEDVVQEAFLKFWQKPKRWSPDKNTQFTTWFYRVVVNLCLDKKKQKQPLPLSPTFDAADKGQDFEEQAQEAEQMQALEAAIQSLPGRQQMAVNLCFIEGVSNKEAAQMMQLKLKALESLLMRAKAKLKSELKI